MLEKTWRYKTLAILVSLTLILQLSLPGWSLMTTSVTAQESTTQLADSLTRPLAISPTPLSISRHQSTYQAGSTVLITYTLSNNQPVTLIPNISETATITDTINTLADFDLTADPNTIHDATLETTLTAAATYLSSSLPPTPSGSTYTWQLPDLPPQSSHTFTLTVQGPATAANFTDLDTGAILSGTLWDLTESATARPAMLAPSSLGSTFLRRTPDADLTDSEMLWFAAAFAQDPLTAFTQVRGMAYEAYTGSLRGTRGTLWNDGGNSADQSSLLIAMLRSAGIPARYRHGSLSPATAQTLIASMFPASQGVAGYLPAGTPTADPVNDSALIAQVQDHWWVEAYLPGSGWTNLDPSFAHANPGDIFVATIASDGTDRIAELPASTRHTLTVSLTREYYHSFPISGTFLSTDNPLTVTFNTAYLAAKPLTLGHIVNTTDQGGTVFATITHDYTPYLTVDGPDDAYEGTTFQDVLSNFPLSSQFTTAEWLEFTLEAPSGQSHSFTREVKDLIGAAARITGGSITLSPPPNNAALLDTADLFSTWILPNTVPDWVINRQVGPSLQTAVTTAQDAQWLNGLDLGNLTPAEESAVVSHTFRLQIESAILLSRAGLEYAATADSILTASEDGLRVRAYFETPRLVTVASVYNPFTDENADTVDLRTTSARLLVYPGQSAAAFRAFNWVKGITESRLEGEALAEISDEPVATTSRLFAAMHDQGIAPLLITPADLSPLDLLADPPAHAIAALNEGKTVLIPAQPVLLDGVAQWGWWEIDPTSGETIGVLENGLHSALVEYKFWISYLNNLSKWPRRYQKAVKKLWNYVVANVVPALGGFAPTQNNADWRYLDPHLCPVAECGLEQFFVSDVPHNAIPLPEMLFGYVPTQTRVIYDQANVTANANLPPGTPAFTLGLNPPATTMNASGTAAFQTTFATNFSDIFTTTVYAPDGWNVTVNNAGQITARPQLGVIPGTYDIQVVAQSRLHPDLFSSTIHPVTILATQAMELAFVPEPNITVPMGNPSSTTPSNDTNDGEAEVPGAAFTVVVTNSSTISHTFQVTIGGQPANQLIFNGVKGTASATITLPAGGVGQMGLYVVRDTLPNSGVSFPVNVTAIALDDPTLNDSAADTFTMPALPFSQVMLAPETIYAAANQPTPFTLHLSNVGNSAASFPLTVTVPISSWTISSLQSPVSLSPNQTNTQNATLTIPGGPLGATYPLLVSSSAPGSEYTQTAVAQVQIVGAFSGAIFIASGQAQSCALGSVALPAAVESLAQSVTTLESNCAGGSCSLVARDGAVAAAHQLATYAQSTSPFITADDDLRSIATLMATHTNQSNLEQDMVDLGAAATLLSTELCQIRDHQPTARWTPLLDATLPGQPITYSLDVTNLGTVATSYAITVSLPTGPTVLNETIAPGDTTSLPFVLAPITLDSYDLTATITAIGSGVTLNYLTAQANARLNVVDKFVQVTAVTPNPAFVETGVSSTTLAIAVSNVAGVARPATAYTEILAPDGSSQWSDTIPLAILAGLPRTYELATVVTSGWAKGTYTVTVDLRDAAANPIPNGTGYGYLSVGEALVASHVVIPELVAPGTVTVTTVITTAIVADTIGSGNLNAPDTYHAPYITQELTPTIPITYPLTFSNTTGDVTEPLAAGGEPLAESSDQSPVPSLSISQSLNLPISQSPLAGFLRTEQDNAAFLYTGSWTNLVNNRASAGSYRFGDDAGDSATLTVAGSWINVGFVADRNSGRVEILIDGISQGILDLYRRDEVAVSFVYDGLINTTHTVTIVVQGNANPLASNDRVYLDYVDAWDNATLPDGTFEQTDPRVLLSGGWSTINDGNASGGNYARSNNGTAWFVFSGSSFTFHSLSNNNSYQANLYLDGQFLTRLDLFAFASITNTFSFTGFVPGPHIVQVSSYRDNTAVDAFTTPGTPPFTNPNPAPGAFTRYEEDHPAFLYNSLPFTTTAQTWTRNNTLVADQASGGQTISSSTAGNTASLTVTGQWINLGLATDTDGGAAEIFLDGVSQGTINLYRSERGVTNRILDGLSNSSHTITLVVISGSVKVDYVDVWDGTPLPDGSFDVEGARFFTSNGWEQRINASANNGNYLRAGNNGNLWFPFTGDSVTFQPFYDTTVGRVKLYLDEQYMGIFELFGNGTTPNFSFDGLGAGVHVLRVEGYRNNSSVNLMITPGIPPFYTPPVYTGIIRWEEDHPAIRYNGLPYTQTVASWDRGNDLSNVRASDGQYVSTLVAGNNASLSFNGSWAGVGLLTGTDAGQAEIFIDGVSQGVVDLFSREPETLSRYYGGLSAGPHTLLVQVLGTKHPNSTNTRVLLDYFDTWDGTPLPDGTFEETDERLFVSDNWTVVVNGAASGGSYARGTSLTDLTAWFPFSGESVTFAAWAQLTSDQVEIKIDGVSRGLFDVKSIAAAPHSLSFTNLGPGPHILELRHYRGEATMDTFITPATGPATVLPTYSGMVRYEEDHPDLSYNGFPFHQTVAGWSMPVLAQASGGFVGRSSTVGGHVALTFSGSWVGVGFHGGNANAGDVEIFLDGVSQGVFDTSSPVETSYFAFPGLITGTHTISVAVLSGTVYFDFFDVYDATPEDDGWVNADLVDRFDRVHFGGHWANSSNIYAFGDNYVARSAGGFANTAWFSFVGDAVTFLAFNRDGSSAEVLLDGVSQGVFDLTAEFSDQPFPLHFDGLSDGPHVLAVYAADSVRVDAFEADPDVLLDYTPTVEWYDIAPTVPGPAGMSNRGMLSSVALGDLDGDGIVELVAPASNGTMYVYRGDGQDAGGGSPLLWSTTLVGAAAEPALVDLDGDGDAEIIVSGSGGTYAFHHDGTVYWSDPTIQATTGDGGSTIGWGGPSVGNLDNDPEPEIVIAASEDALYVLDHDGDILFQDPIGQWPTVPVLADITSDGVLDIIVAQAHTLKVYDFASGGNVAWSYTLTNTTIRSGAFGAPGVADIDGDGQPEIIINWGHRVEALDHDGSLLWSYYTGNDLMYRPSQIAIADVDGDGVIELITGSAINAGFLVFNHNLMVLNPDGTLLWEQLVADNTASASGVATQDLDGDGIWEILWNGATDGFLVIRGADGERLFNEPFTGSGTVLDYPTLGDVDGDGYAEVVVGGTEGVFVIGHDEVWTASRPLWNSHDYHISNIHDDWSVPANEPPSWTVHNTYRTQTPLVNPAPSYGIVMTHTVGLTGVQVLTNTFSLPVTLNHPNYGRDYVQAWYQPVITLTFNTVLPDMQPGEVRQVAQGTTVTYNLLSGQNQLQLPPLYVSAPHVVTISPAEQVSGPGGMVVYTATLTNYGAVTETFSLDVVGFAAAWATYPAQITLGGGQVAEVELQLAVPFAAATGTFPFSLDVSTGAGGADQTSATLQVVEGLAMTLAPAVQSGTIGQPITYTLTLTNLTPIATSYDLSVTGTVSVTLPASVLVAGNGTVDVELVAVSSDSGPHPFGVVAAASNGSGATSEGVLDIPTTAQRGVSISLSPATGVGGPGTPISYTVTVTNSGTVSDTFALNVTVPAGWAAQLLANGNPVTAITLNPFAFNTAELLLLVTPANNATPGNYPVSVEAVSQGDGVVMDVAAANAQLLNRGVEVTVTPGSVTLNPTQTGTWSVQIRNRGTVADTYNLTAHGAIANSMQFSASSVTLNPGQVQTVQLTGTNLDFFLPGTYQFVVLAVSQGDGRIKNEDAAAVTLTSYEAVEVAWRPETQTITDTLTATFLLVISNTGNIATEYQFTISAPGLTLTRPVTELLIPAHGVVALPVVAAASGNGIYQLTGTASNPGGPSGNAAATLTITGNPEPNPPTLYLPIMMKP